MNAPERTKTEACVGAVLIVMGFVMSCYGAFVMLWAFGDNDSSRGLGHALYAALFMAGGCLLTRWGCRI